jgi:hypothetical protein
LDVYVDYEVTAAREAFQQAIFLEKHAFFDIAAVFEPACKDDTNIVYHHKRQVKNSSNSSTVP